MGIPPGLGLRQSSGALATDEEKRRAPAPTPAPVPTQLTPKSPTTCGSRCFPHQQWWKGWPCHPYPFDRHFVLLTDQGEIHGQITPIFLEYFLGGPKQSAAWVNRGPALQIFTLGRKINLPARRRWPGDGFEEKSTFESWVSELLTYSQPGTNGCQSASPLALWKGATTPSSKSSRCRHHQRQRSTCRQD